MISSNNNVQLTSLLFLISQTFVGSVDGWIFSRSEPLVAENETCDPLDQAWRPYPGDQTKFLYCEVSQRKYLVGTCQALNGIAKFFDESKQQCIEKEQSAAKAQLQPTSSPVVEKRVGDGCRFNTDCSDGMYCNSAVCACFLNYIEVNLKCIRVSSICPSSHFYAEQSSGKPRTCVLDAHCPTGFSCDVHPGAPDISFCCHKTGEKNVCGTTKAYFQNSKEVSCSPELAHCPNGYSCQFNSNLNRHFCCELTVTNNWFSSLTPTTINYSPSSTTSPLITNATVLTTPIIAALEEVRSQTIALAESVCGIGSAPWLYENYPMPCNPNPPSNCPPIYVCKARPGSKLYFCCTDGRSTTSLPSTVSGSGSSSSSTLTTATVAPASVCLSSAPYLLNGQPLLCINSDPKSCPEGYICESQNILPKFHWADHQPLGNLSFCCSVFVSSTTPSTVPTVPNASTQRHIEKMVCPLNSEPFKIQDKPVMCIRTDPQSCPQHYSCQYHEPSRVHFCCKDFNQTTSSAGFSATSISSSSTFTSSVGSTSILPSTSSSSLGSTPFISTLGSSSSSQFPSSSSSSSSTSGIPSSPTPSTSKFEPDGCPPQTVSALDHQGQAVLCSLISAPLGCPLGFNCLYSELHLRYQCCGIRSTSTISTSSFSSQTFVASTAASTIAPSIIDDGCPSGQRAYKDPVTSQAISCVANQLDSCPGGYFCQFSANSNKFQCCGVHAGCPRDSIAYISLVTGAVQYCALDDKSCPPGYRCDMTQEGQKVCCSSGGSAEAQLNPSVRVCPIGDPVMDRDQIKFCSDSNICPFGYSCLPSIKGPVCCPDPQTICTQTLSIGQPCTTGGVGSQRGYRYYFNIEKGVCQSFPYEGCAGNGNNFESLQECSAFCFQGLCPRGLPARFDSNTPLRCNNAKQDCPPDYTCTVAAYGPQGSHVCCPKPDLICNLFMHEGQKCEESGKAQPIIRFFFDSNRGSCQPFSYHGCGGNANNFISIVQCQSFCGGFATTDFVSSTKIAGVSSSSLSVPTSIPVTATPTGFSTTTSGTSTNSGGILASQFCPVAGEFLPTDPLYHSCNPLVPYSCPHGYSCQNSTRKVGFICCGSPTLHVKGPTCPTGSDVYIHPATRQPHVCTLDKNGCPDKYICVFSEPLREYFCCSSNLPSTPLFPRSETCAGSDPFFYPGTFQPLSCRPGTVCPKGFECKKATTGDDDYICCAIGQRPIDLNDRSRENGPRYYPRPNRLPLPFQANWYPLAGGFQTWNNGLVDSNYLPQRTTQFRPSQQPPFTRSSNQLVKPLPESKVVVDQTNCNKSDAKQLGAECCAHEQCTYNFCSEYKNTKYCACPRHLLLDFTYDVPRCVNSCAKWRENAFCVPTPPDVPLGLIRLRFGTRLTDRKRRS